MDHTFEQLVQLVQAHHNPVPSETVQCFTFNTQSQKEGETISQFMAELRRLPELCKFDATLEDMIGVWCSRRQHTTATSGRAEIHLQDEICQSTNVAEKNARIEPEVQGTLVVGISPVTFIKGICTTYSMLSVWWQSALSAGLPFQNGRV